MHKFLKMTFLAALAVPMLLLAAAEDDYVPVGTRPPKSAAFLLKRNAACCFCFKPHSSFAPTQYQIVDVFISGDVGFGDGFLELQDGTRWKFSSYDNDKVAEWYPGDHIMITQNTSWVGNNYYKLINQTRGGRYIETNVIRGPKRGGEHTRYIASIDFHKGRVILSDNTYWDFDPSDASTFREWAPQDAILIGRNSGWGHDGLLININMNVNQPVRARQY